MEINIDEFFEYDLLVRVAWTYYIDGLTQEKIGKMYGMTRIKVQRMLQEAVNRHFVTVSIKNPFYNLLQVERELIDKYSLTDAIVVPTIQERLYQDLTKATAIYLERQWMSKITSLGIGAGRTLNFMGNAFNSIVRKSITANPAVISLNGVLSSDAALSSLDNGQQVAQAIGSVFYGIWGPSLTQTKTEAKVFANQKIIKDALEMANNVDIKVVSIGKVIDNDNWVFFKNKLISQSEYSELISKGVIGEILAHFFDHDGNLIDNIITKRSIVIDFPSKKGKVIAVSGGTEKEAVIKSALKGKLVDVLVTDYETCKFLLE